MNEIVQQKNIRFKYLKENVLMHYNSRDTHSSIQCFLFYLNKRCSEKILTDKSWSIMIGSYRDLYFFFIYHVTLTDMLHVFFKYEYYKIQSVWPHRMSRGYFMVDRF